MRHRNQKWRLFQANLVFALTFGRQWLLWPSPLHPKMQWNPYLGTKPLLDYYLTSRASPLRQRNQSSRIFLVNQESDTISENAISASNARLKFDVPRTGNVSSSSFSSLHLYTASSTALIERLEYYLSSKTSLLKPGRNYAPTLPNVKRRYWLRPVLLQDQSQQRHHHRRHHLIYSEQRKKEHRRHFNNGVNDSRTVHRS